jgi:hypothetical protein
MMVLWFLSSRVRDDAQAEGHLQRSHEARRRELFPLSIPGRPHIF